MAKMQMESTLPRKSAFGEVQKNFSKHRYIYIMFLPVFIYYVIFHYLPMFGISIAFMDYKPARGFLESEWVGFENFIKFFSGPYAKRTIRNTIVLNVYSLLWGFPAPIIFALLLNELGTNRYKKVMQTLSYLPYFISTVVACGIVVIFVQSNGLITTALNMLGLVSKSDMLAKPQYFRSIYIASDIWQYTGWGSIIYLATLSRVDLNLYEAADIDGAGRFRKIIYITLPALIPIIVVQLIMKIGSIMSIGANKVILLYRPSTYETSDLISSYVYRAGLLNQDYSIGAAVDLFNAIINIGLLSGANYVSRQLTEESLW